MSRSSSPGINAKTSDSRLSNFFRGRPDSRSAAEKAKPLTSDRVGNNVSESSGTIRPVRVQGCEGDAATEEDSWGEFGEFEEFSSETEFGVGGPGGVALSLGRAGGSSSVTVTVAVTVSRRDEGRVEGEGGGGRGEGGGGERVAKLEEDVEGKGPGESSST